MSIKTYALGGEEHTQLRRAVDFVLDNAFTDLEPEEAAQLGVGELLIDYLWVELGGIVHLQRVFFLHVLA